MLIYISTVWAILMNRCPDTVLADAHSTLDLVEASSSESFGVLHNRIKRWSGKVQLWVRSIKGLENF
jgi:hypothetical protein